MPVNPPAAETVDDRTNRPLEEGRKLVFLLHAYTSSPAKLEPLRKEISRLWPDAEIVVPDLPLSTFSVADPNIIAATLARRIDEQFTSGHYTSIVLVGHSVGALLARKIYVIACGERERAPFEPGVRRALAANHGLFEGFAWHKSIERLVLLAAMNRGWRVSHHISLTRAPLWAVGTLIGQAIDLLTGRRPLILQVRRGAQFITNLRVQWIVLRNAQRQEGIPGPLTIQLLGSRDDMVAPDDNVDLVSGSHFVYLDVPNSTHANVIDVGDRDHGEGRLEVIRAALTESTDVLARLAVLPSDDHLVSPELDVTHVAFVIHGIRDAGYWTHKIARRVRRFGEARNERWATETSSYGYFPMAPFLSPIGRRAKVEWMMDQYAESLAKYPNATFHYIGHSNGTYLLAKALQLYPGCRFGRVVFAGSVVRRRYDWTSAVTSGQVESVLNFVATADWVVAFFPRLFEFFPVQDLGSAGHLGFITRSGTLPQAIVENRRVRGRHDAGIREPLWDDIARYVLDRRVPPGAAAHPSWFVRLLGGFPPVVWLFIVAVLCVIWWLISQATPDGFVEGFACALYIVAIVGVLRSV